MRGTNISLTEVVAAGRAVHLGAHEPVALGHGLALGAVAVEVPLVAAQLGEPFEFRHRGVVAERRHVRRRGPARAAAGALQGAGVRDLPFAHAARQPCGATLSAELVVILSIDPLHRFCFVDLYPDTSSHDHRSTALY